MKTLDESQIKQLKNFIKSHYVPYYDVQLELIDHMGNAIEALWKTDPNIPFAVAKEKVFNGFGVFGFQPILEEKQKVLQKRYNKLLLHTLFDFFKNSKLLVLLTAIFVLFILFREIALPLRKMVFVAILLIINLVTLYLAFNYRKKVKRQTKITGKSWLFEASSTSEVVMLMLTLFPFQLVNFVSTNSVIWVEDRYLLLLVTFLVLVILAVYIMFFVLPNKIHIYIKNKYSNFDFSIV